jgi:hypothetical protein
MKARVAKGITVEKEEVKQLQQVNGTLVLYPLRFFEQSLEELRHTGKGATDIIFQ